jgi:hypothetical protein
VLQPRYGKGYYRAACALGKLGTVKDVSAAHSIMRYAAQLEGSPAAELLAQLPPLPPNTASEPPLYTAMEHVLRLLSEWPLLMCQRAARGQQFMWRLPGELSRVPLIMVCPRMARLDARCHGTHAMVYKQRGNAAFVAGDTATALQEYEKGINRQRTLAFLYLLRNEDSIEQAAMAAAAAGDDVDDPHACMLQMRYMMASRVYGMLYPYLGLQYATTIKQGIQLLPGSLRLPENIRDRGRCDDLPTLALKYWDHIISLCMEPFGGMQGPLVKVDAMPCDIPVILRPPDFDPHA